VTGGRNEYLGQNVAVLAEWFGANMSVLTLIDPPAGHHDNSHIGSNISLERREFLPSPPSGRPISDEDATHGCSDRTPPASKLEGKTVLLAYNVNMFSYSAIELS
jgi:hypothetical protein